MREFRRKNVEHRPPRLIRGTDGRLRSATARDDIGDIWAEQRRIRLQEAIEEDKRRAAKAAARKERWRKLLKRGKKDKPKRADTGEAGKKVVEINISLPAKVKLPKLPKPKRLKKKHYAVTVVVLAVMAAAYGGFLFFADRSDTLAQKGKSNDTLGAADKQPRYDTLLPEGKTIEQLGGWARVSPPDKVPVFAFIDEVSGVQVNVSQQALPQSFDGDGRAAAAEIAKDFGANESIAVDTTTVYIGTSAKGPQSVIFVKGELLILMKSTSRLTNDQWAAYVASLR
jgi:hypothetical protein